MYYIGIDASGAYTRLAACDADLRLIGRHTGQISSKSKKESLTKLLYEFNKMTNTVLDSCAGLCIGAAEGDVKNYEDIINVLAYPFASQVVCEQRLAVSAHTNAGAGVVVHSAAKAWAAAVNEKDELYTIDSLPKPVDDGASAYSMGLAAIRAALMAEDGRAGKTALTPRIAECLGITNINTLKKDASKLTETAVAEVGLLVKYVSEGGDNTALEIESQTAFQLSLMANALIAKSGLKNAHVCMAGSVLLTNENIQNMFIGLVTGKNKDAKVLPLKEKLEMGALYIATKLK